MMGNRFRERPDGVFEECPGHSALWGWFGLSRASWLTLPRSVMHEMPDEWQGKMAALLKEFDHATRNAPEEIQATPTVVPRNGNRFGRWPGWLLNYRHSDPRHFEWMDASAQAQAGKREEGRE